MPALPERIGPYLVEAQLGAGSMGVVLRVRHAELDAPYALKVLRPELCAGPDLERFRREMELLAAISDHPNVVRIHTADEAGGRLYYVMDLVEGRDLQRVVTDEARPGEGLEPRRAARYVRDVARAIAALHARGIVHRDVKPANIIIDDRDCPRLSDFGLARAFLDERSRLTRTGDFVGTPIYMAPEQAMGRRVGPPADVYALGMVLYTLLAGEPAVRGTTTVEVMNEVRSGAHRPLSRAAPGVPAPLAALCMRCLAVDPAKRPPTAGALADALDGYLRGEAQGGDGRRATAAAVAVSVVVLAALASAWILAGRGPDHPPLSQVVTRAEAGLGEERDRVAAGEAPRSERLRSLREELAAALAREGAAPAAARALLGRLLALEGEGALVAGDAPLARRRLEEASALADPEGERPLRELHALHLAGLRGGLAALDPREDDDLAPRLADLERAADAAPQRMDLRAWHVALALRAGRGREAARVVERSPRPKELPAELRCRAYLAAGDLERALALEGELSDEAVEGALHYRLGLRALEAGTRDVPGARAHLEQAVALAPEDPRRSEAARRAAALAEEAGRWRRGSDVRLLVVKVRQEIDAAALAVLLDPDYVVPGERFDELYRVLLEVGPVLKGETMDLVRGLIAVAPRDVAPSVYRLYATLAVDWGLPDPARDVALIEQGLELASDAPTRRQLTRDLAVALHMQHHVDELIGLAERIRGSEAQDELRAFVLGRAGDLLRFKARLAEAEALLEEAWRLDPEDQDLRLFRFGFHRDRYLQGGAPADREAALSHAWRFLQDYTAASWDDWLPHVCSWVALEEERAGDVDAARRALDVLVRFQPYQLRWAVHRLRLLAAAEPFPAAALTEGLEELAGQLEQVAAEVRDEGRRQADRAQRAVWERRADELLQVPTRHLQGLVELEDVAQLREGLAALEDRLAQLEAR